MAGARRRRPRGCRAVSSKTARRRPVEELYASPSLIEALTAAQDEPGGWDPFGDQVVEARY